MLQQLLVNGIIAGSIYALVAVPAEDSVLVYLQGFTYNH